MTLPIVNTGSLVTGDVFTTWTLSDTDNCGYAALNYGQAIAWLGTDKGIFSPYVETPLDPDTFVPAFDIATTSEVMLTVFDDTTALADPASSVFMYSQYFTDLEFDVLAATLSPGDTIKIQAYACIADATQTCPVRPDLDAVFSAVPLPAAIWLFSIGTCVLGLFG